MISAADQASQRNQEHPVIAILLFDEVEVLDFAGPYEVFAAARDESGERYTRVFTVAARSAVKCYGGLSVIADATFYICPGVVVLMVSCGPRAPGESVKH